MEKAKQSKEIAQGEGTTGIVKVITRGLVGKGLSNNTRKCHLLKVHTVENKKVRPERISIGQIISFLDDDYPKGFD